MLKNTASITLRTEKKYYIIKLNDLDVTTSWGYLRPRKELGNVTHTFIKPLDALNFLTDKIINKQSGFYV